MSENRKNLSTQRVPNRDVNAAMRAATALSLRAQKLTFEEIAHRTGFTSASACRKAILRELDRHVVKHVDELRQEELHMLDCLHAVVWPLAMPSDDERDEKGKKKKPNLFAVDRILAISERRAKLMGLDVSKDGNIAAAQVVIREVPQGYLALSQEHSS